MSKAPAEVFGIPYQLVTSNLERIKAGYVCPFLGRRCVKQSTHRDMADVPFGVCSVWYKPGFQNASQPHIICPKRLGTNEAIQRTVSLLAFGGGHELLEGVRIRPLGTMDYVAVVYDRTANKVLDFAGIEVMAVSTTSTGGLIHAFMDAIEGRPGCDYDYGINYRQVLSRMLVQLCAKGSAFSTWGKKTIWIVQDVLYDYMVDSYDLRLAEGSREPDPILLMVYSLAQDSGAFSLRLREVRSGQPRHFSDLLFSTDIPTRTTAESLILKKIAKLKGNASSSTPAGRPVAK